MPKNKKRREQKSAKKDIETRIPGVEPGAVEKRAVTPEEVRVNDVTATPYPIELIWSDVFVEGSDRKLPLYSGS